MYINEIEAIYYDKQITGEETIKILGSNKKSIEIKAEYINWRVNEFDSLFDSENFMLCFRFPYNSDINYIKMDETFSQGYDELFYKVIKSQVVKQAMMFDDEARKFKYLYSNEDILKEIKNNTYLVCLPFDNYYGFSDKNAFVVYLKSNFSFKEIKKTLVTFDNLIRTQYHEYKHISRIYYHMVDDNLELKTPTFSLSQFKGDRNYINNIYQESLEIVKKKTANISENSKCFQKTFDEYGDLVEYAINGFKVEVQMIRSVLFCLDNSSWDMDPTIFNKNLLDNMRLDTSGFTLSNFAKGFGKTIYNYFDFVQKDDYTLNCTIFSTKSASSNGFNNEVIETTIFSHHMSRGNNDL